MKQRGSARRPNEFDAQRRASQVPAISPQIAGVAWRDDTAIGGEAGSAFIAELRLPLISSLDSNVIRRENFGQDQFFANSPARLRCVQPQPNGSVCDMPRASTTNLRPSPTPHASSRFPTARTLLLSIRHGFPRNTVFRANSGGSNACRCPASRLPFTLPDSPSNR